MTAVDPRPPRILVVRYRFIGDTVLAIPFLRNLRRAFPDSVIDVLAEPISGATLALCPYKDELLYYTPGKSRKKSRHPTGVFSCARMLRARRYDRVYILRRSFSSAVLAWLARIPHRVGFATEGRRWLLQRSVPYARQHEAECFLDLLRADGIPVVDTHNENWSDPATDAIVDDALSPAGRRRVFVAAKSFNAPKEWTPDRFARVLDWLVAEHNTELHFCDAPGNVAYYQAIVDLMSPTHRTLCTDWSTRLGIRELGSLMRRMDLAFGLDTGLLHLAASFHVPVAVLFGSDEPFRWHPWDTRQAVMQPDDPHAAQPLLQFSADDVIDLLRRHLPELLPGA